MWAMWRLGLRRAAPTARLVLIFILLNFAGSAGTGLDVNGQPLMKDGPAGLSSSSSSSHRAPRNFLPGRPVITNTQVEGVQRPNAQCDFYNKTSCPASNPHCQRTERCQIAPNQRTHCFVFWNVTKGHEQVVMKGCWVGPETCQNQTKCEPRIAANGGQSSGHLYFCCCEGDFCNRNITPKSFPPPQPTTTVSTSTPIMTKRNLTFQTVQYTIFPMLGLFLLLPVCYIYRRRKAARANHMPLPTSEPVNSNGPTGGKGLCGTVVLDRRRARGRFGEVYSAFYQHADGTVATVAVKIFHPQERKSWQVEQSFYNSISEVSHENILQFFGVEERQPAGGPSQLWLITDFHERGSLYDHLKGSLVSWSELVSVAVGMARGLQFLHDAETFGPAVAHRDFKSKNVLLKADMTACIADFGLSLRFEQTPGQVHGQVGTRRYMAPEVLDGAINFNCHDFLCIDMYAMGLVLWEVVSRCSSADGPIAEYQLPFEDEVGLHPTLEDMQDLCVRRKVRPPIKEHWKSHPLIGQMCNTIDECWDQDAEARLSASTVVERIEHFPRTDPKGPIAAPPTLNPAPPSTGNNNLTAGLQQQEQNINSLNNQTNQNCNNQQANINNALPLTVIGGIGQTLQDGLPQHQQQQQQQQHQQHQLPVPPPPSVSLDSVVVIGGGDNGGFKPLAGSGQGLQCGRGGDCWNPPLTASQA